MRMKMMFGRWGNGAARSAGGRMRHATAVERTHAIRPSRSAPRARRPCSSVAIAPSAGSAVADPDGQRLDALEIDAQRSQVDIPLLPQPKCRAGSAVVEQDLGAVDLCVYCPGGIGRIAVEVQDHDALSNVVFEADWSAVFV